MMMAPSTPTDDPAAPPAHETIIRLVGERSANLYHTQGLCCSEAILVAFNEIFQGGLSPEQAVNLGAVFCGGMGGAGCLCGALAGAAMSLGLLIGPRAAGGLSSRQMRELTAKLHDRFHERFGSPCCRVLTQAVQHDSRAKLQQCRGITDGAARLAAELLLATRPGFAGRADGRRLTQRDTRLSGLLKRLKALMGG